MTTFPLPQFDWTVYAYDPALFEKELDKARFQHRMYEEQGVIYFQPYDISQHIPYDQPFTPPLLSLDPRVIKLFTIKKWLLGATFLISYKDLEWPSMLSRLASYVTYYQTLQDLWLIKKDPDILSRWWSVESTRYNMHHSPTDDLDPHTSRGIDYTVQKACAEWMMQEIWEVGDLEKVSHEVIDEVTLYMEDWINRGIVLDMGHLPMTNLGLPPCPLPNVGQEEKESSTSGKCVVSFQNFIQHLPKWCPVPHINFREMIQSRERKAFKRNGPKSDHSSLEPHGPSSGKPSEINILETGVNSLRKGD